MISAVVIFLVFAIAMVAPLKRPAWGVAGFYFFYLLDPLWNWRWALPANFEFQKYLFAALVAGAIVHGFHIFPKERLTRIGFYALSTFFFVNVFSAYLSAFPETTSAFISVLWKQVVVTGLSISLIKTRQDVKLLLLVTIVATSYNALQINLDYFQTGLSRYAYRNWGSYGLDNNTLAILMCPTIAISLGLAVSERSTWRRYLYFTAAVLVGHQIMLSMSRGAMIGALPGLAFICWKAPRTKQNTTSAVLFVTCTIMLAGPSITKEFLSSFKGGDQRDSSAESRLYLWEAGLRITMDKPILGVGPNAARHYVPRPEYWKGPPLTERGKTMNQKALHNLFFDLSAGTGLLGLISYLCFSTLPCFYLWQSKGQYKDGLALAVVAGQATYLSCSVFSSGLLIESPYILAIAGYGLINSAVHEQHCMHEVSAQRYDTNQITNST